MSLRERIARAIASADGEDGQVTYGQMADAVLAELGPELAPQPQADVPRTVAVDIAREAMRVGNLHGHVRTVEGYWSEEIDDRFADFMGEYTAPQPQPSAEDAP